jgi:hypothetical protein
MPSDDLPVPTSFALARARPNPSHGSVTLDFTLPQTELVSLHVFEGGVRLCSAPSEKPESIRPVIELRSQCRAARPRFGCGTGARNSTLSRPPCGALSPSGSKARISGMNAELAPVRKQVVAGREADLRLIRAGVARRVRDHRIQPAG